MPQTEVKQTGVLIVGAGPVGLSLACDLAKRGTYFTIIDQRLEHSKHTKAIVVHARTLEHMDALGPYRGSSRKVTLSPNLKYTLKARNFSACLLLASAAHFST